MPDSRRWVCHFVAHEPEAIVSWIRLDRFSRARPCPDGRQHSDCVTYWRKAEIIGAAYAILAIGGVVIHVAFRGMRLAPAVFARGDILSFSKVGRALIERCVEIVHFHAYPVRHAIVIMPVVIVCIRWKVTSERVDPGARTDLVLVAV